MGLAHQNQHATWVGSDRGHKSDMAIIIKLIWISTCLSRGHTINTFFKFDARHGRTPPPPHGPLSLIKIKLEIVGFYLVFFAPTDFRF